MLLLDFFRWMDGNLPGSLYLREATFAFSFLLTAHVITMCLFFGLIIMMDLRLAGFGNLRTPPAEIQRRLFPWQMTGFVGSAVTGILLFYSKPLFYYGKGYFWLKLALMVLAGINAGIIHLITHRAGGGWDSRAARVAGAASLILWSAVLITGRLIAYEWWTAEYL